MTYWRDRIQKRFAEVEASMTSLRESINSVVEITEGEAGHYKEECERLQNDNRRLREHVLAVESALIEATRSNPLKENSSEEVR